MYRQKESLIWSKLSIVKFFKNYGAASSHGKDFCRVGPFRSHVATSSWFHLCRVSRCFLEENCIQKKEKKVQQTRKFKMLEKLFVLIKIWKMEKQVHKDYHSREYPCYFVDLFHVCIWNLYFLFPIRDAMWHSFRLIDSWKYLTKTCNVILYLWNGGAFS